MRGPILFSSTLIFQRQHNFCHRYQLQILPNGYIFVGLQTHISRTLVLGVPFLTDTICFSCPYTYNVRSNGVTGKFTNRFFRFFLHFSA